MKRFGKFNVYFAVTFFFICIFSIYIFAQSCPPESAKSNKFPFEFVKNQIVLSVSVQGRENYNMLLDTGVIPSVIDLELAKELSLPLETDKVGTASGRGNAKIEIIPATIKNLGINGQNYGDIEAVAMNLDYLGKPLGMKLHGILGYSLLKDKILQIDYQNKTVEFFENGKELYKKLKGEFYLEKFTFEDEDIIPIVRGIKINGRKLIASIDTGSSLNVEIFSHNLEKLELQNMLQENAKRSTIVGGQGKADVLHTKINLLNLGLQEFTDQEITVSAVKNTNQTRLGNIGNKFLKNFLFSLDYPNKLIMLKRVEAK